MITKEETIVSINKELRQQPIGKAFPSLIKKAVAWLSEIYDDVDFDNVHMFALRKWHPGGRLCAVYKVASQDVVVTDNQYPFFTFYGSTERAIRYLAKPAMVPDWWRSETVGPGLNREGLEKMTMLRLIHELTHHVQHQRGFHKGNELDTALNELYWLQQNDRPAYKCCFEEKFPILEPPTIRRRRRGEPLPWYLRNSGRSHKCKPSLT